MKTKDWTTDVYPGAGHSWKMHSSQLYMVRTVHGFVIAWVGDGESYFRIILYGVEHCRLVQGKEYTQRGVMRAVNRWLKELTQAE